MIYLEKTIKTRVYSVFSRTTLTKVINRIRSALNTSRGLRFVVRFRSRSGYYRKRRNELPKVLSEEKLLTHAHE